MASILFMVVTELVPAGDGRIYPRGSYAVINDNDQMVTSGIITGTFPVSNSDDGGAIQAKFQASCRDDCGDQSLDSISVTGSL